jgi:hypothetical protein
MAAWTFRILSLETFSGVLSARETVATETPAMRATSLILDMVFAFS